MERTKALQGLSQDWKLQQMETLRYKPLKSPPPASSTSTGFQEQSGPHVLMDIMVLERDDYNNNINNHQNFTLQRPNPICKEQEFFFLYHYIKSWEQFSQRYGQEENQKKVSFFLFRFYNF